MADTVTATPRVYEAIRQVQALVAKSGIGKARKNEQQGYFFRGIDDVLNTLSPALSEAGLVVIPYVGAREMTERTTRSGQPLFSVVLTVDFLLVATADGSSASVRTIGEAMDTADKATNKAMSAAYKYMALLAFCIPVVGDDADATTHEVAPVEPPALPPEAQAWLDRLRVAAVKGTPSLRAEYKTGESGWAKLIPSTVVEELKALAAEASS